MSILSVFESIGIKRLVASLLSTIAEILKAIPGAGEYVTLVDMIAGVFGITGIAHATKEKTLDEKKLATASAAVAALLALTYFIPVLIPFQDELQKLAALLGAAALGAHAKQKEVENKEPCVSSERISEV